MPASPGARPRRKSHFEPPPPETSLFQAPWGTRVEEISSTRFFQVARDRVAQLDLALFCQNDKTVRPAAMGGHRIENTSRLDAFLGAPVIREADREDLLPRVFS